jgi:hypothetical protein
LFSEEEEDESGAFISSRLASFESILGLILGVILGVIPEEDAGDTDDIGVELVGIGVELVGIGGELVGIGVELVGIGAELVGIGTGVCMRSFTELATTLAFVAPITVSTAARAS